MFDKKLCVFFGAVATLALVLACGRTPSVESTDAAARAAIVGASCLLDSECGAGNYCHRHFVPMTGTPLVGMCTPLAPANGNCFSGTEPMQCVAGYSCNLATKLCTASATTPAPSIATPIATITAGD